MECKPLDNWTYGRCQWSLVSNDNFWYAIGGYGTAYHGNC